jgi:glycosyltransferase involved in cell wall biosynthesis
LSKKKILFLLHLPPPHHGASTVGMQLKNSDLINKRFDSTFYNISTSSSINFSLFKSFLIYLKKSFLIFKLLFKINPDLIYYTMTANGLAFIKDFFIVFMISKKYGKIVLHFHNKGIKNNNNFIFKLVYKYIFKKCHIVLLSERLTYDFAEYDLHKTLNFCSNGISYQNKVLNDENYLSKKYDFLFLSNLIKEKGVVDYVMACAKIKQSFNRNFKAAIVGKPADINLSDLNFLIKKYNLEKNIDVLGPLYNEEKVNVFKDSKVFVFPTYYHFECFPLVLIEAMFFKMPLISTNEGAIEDLLINGYNGLIVKKNDHYDLFSAMSLLLNDSDKSMLMAQNSYKHYKNNFTEEHFYNNFVRIIEKIINYE